MIMFVGEQQWVRVNQRTHFPLTPMYYPLFPASTFRFLPQCYVNVYVTLAWYQQAGGGEVV